MKSTKLSINHFSLFLIILTLNSCTSTEEKPQEVEADPTMKILDLNNKEFLDERRAHTTKKLEKDSAGSIYEKIEELDQHEDELVESRVVEEKKKVEKIKAIKTSTNIPERTYIVKDGDYLMKIAHRELGHAFKWKQIMEDNNLTQEDLQSLAIGMKLKIIGFKETSHLPGKARVYKIKKGDTLGEIATELYGTKNAVSKLIRYNPWLKDHEDQIYFGVELHYIED